MPCTEHLRQLRAAQGKFLQDGVTSIGDCQVTRRELDTYLRLSARNVLKTRVSMYLLANLLEQTIEFGIPSAFGNSRLASIKFFADGTLAGWTAYFPDGHVWATRAAPGRSTMSRASTPNSSPGRIPWPSRPRRTRNPPPRSVWFWTRSKPPRRPSPRTPGTGSSIAACPAQIVRMKELGAYPVNQPQHYSNWGEGVTETIGTEPTAAALHRQGRRLR